MEKNYVVVSPKNIEVKVTEHQHTMLRYLNTLTPEEATAKLQEHFTVLDGMIATADQFEKQALIDEYNSSSMTYTLYASRYTVKESAARTILRGTGALFCSAAKKAAEFKDKMAEDKSPLRSVVVPAAAPTAPGLKVPEFMNKTEVAPVGEFQGNAQVPNPFGKQL